MNDRYATLFDAYRWLIPAQFNIAEACVYRWTSNTHEGRNTALYYEDAQGKRERWTYTKLSEMAQRLANGLTRMQVAPGERVAVVMSQRPEAIAALIAILSVGATAVPIPSHASANTIRARLRDCEARVAFVDTSGAPHTLQTQAPLLKQVISFGFSHDNAMAWHTLLARQPATFKIPLHASTQPALLLYPEETVTAAQAHQSGALLAHTALIGVLPGFVASQNWFPRPGDVFCCADWHAGGNWLYGVLATLYFGRPLVLAPHASSPEETLSLMARYRVSNACLSTDFATQITQIPGLLERYSDALSLRALAVQGSPLNAEVVTRYRTALGLTPNLVWNTPQAIAVLGESHLQWPGRPGSLGRTYPGHRISTVDHASRPCAAGVVGELILHPEDQHQHPDPVLPVTFSDAAQGVSLGLRGYMDTHGYLWPAPDTP